MGYRRIVFIAAAFTIAVWAVVRATGDELVSKESLSKEPFGDLQPFDLSKQAAQPGEDTKKSSDSEKALAADKETLERNQKASDEILKVNDLGDPKRIVFEGVSLFPEDDLRRALACDLKYQTAARPSRDTGDLLDALQARLTEGYLHSGCPDAKVRAQHDGKRKTIVVRVNEGIRYRKGEIHVSGAKHIEEEAVRELLTKLQPARPWVLLIGDKRLEQIDKTQREYETPEVAKTQTASEDAAPAAIWKSGDTFDFRKLRNDPLEIAVRGALVELGRADTRFQIELPRDNKRGTVDLQISIVEERPRVAVGNIEVNGLKRDSQDAFLRLLEITPGDSIDGSGLRRINQRLTDSCRYWTHKITVAVPASRVEASSTPANVTLRFDLEEYTDAPPLGEPLSPTDDVMRKCGVWINSLANGFDGHDLVCTTAAVDLTGLAQHAQLAISADGMLVVNAQLKSKATLQFDHSVILGAKTAELYDWQFRDKFCGSPLLQPTFQVRIVATHDGKGEQAGALYFGYSAKSGDDMPASAKMLCDVRAEPAALIRLAHRLNAKASSRDGILTLSDEPFEIQINESTGAVRGFKCASFLAAGISAVDIKAEKGAVARMTKATRRRGSEFRNGYDEAAPLGSILKFTLKQIERQPCVQQSPSLTQLFERAASAIDGNECQQLLASLRKDVWSEGTTDRFWIPASDKISLSSWSSVARFFAPLAADKTFPRESWPWTLCREYSFLAFAGGGADETAEQFQQKVAVELNRMFGRKDFGPLGGLVMAKLLRAYLGNDNKSVAATATLSLEDLTDEAFLKDVHLLTNGDDGLAIASRAIAEKCGGLSKEDLDVIEQLLPRVPRNAFAKLIARRDEKPDELPADAIRAVMLEGWHGGWKDAVEAELRSMSTEAASAAKVSAAEK